MCLKGNTERERSFAENLHLCVELKFPELLYFKGVLKQRHDKLIQHYEFITLILPPHTEKVITTYHYIKRYMLKEFLQIYMFFNCRKAQTARDKVCNITFNTRLTKSISE